MDHWSEVVKQWRLLGPPLRPCAADVAIVAARVAGARRALVLGVTPELVGLPWPHRAGVIASDRSPAMVHVLHPAPGAIVADWRALPIASGALDLAVGDGVLTTLPYPAGYRALARELQRVLAPGGRAIVRVFAAPERRDDVAAIEPRGDGFHALKWRLAMALGETVGVAAIRDAFDARFPDRAALAARTGWSRDVIDSIDVYRGSRVVFSFPTLARAAAALAPELAVVDTVVPDYELGCPTIVLRRVAP
nr:class I SAM-dependent methyltransferase [Kofleriaceae bacterium]